MNTKHTIMKYTEEPSLDDFCVVKKFNEWMVQAKDEPVPRMLFGTLWREGEIAVLTGDPGVGKSLLAVQIAESIARGKSFLSSPPYEGGVAPASGDGVVLYDAPDSTRSSVDADAENHHVGETPTPLLRKEGSFLAEDEPFACTAKPQNVLYLNLKLSTKQFAMRYSAEHDAEDGKTLLIPYKFSQNLNRVDIDIHAKLPEGYKTFDEILVPLVERLIKKYKAKIVIIDNITLLQRSVYGYRETNVIMKGLDRIKRKRGVSILVLARTSKYGSVRDSAAGSCPALFSRYADSVFTIGRSRLDPSVRYIKQLIVHSSEMLYDASHVASFVLKRAGGNFLSFRHYGFCPESEHKKPVSDESLWPTIDKVKNLSDNGKKSVRDVAAELGLSKSSVQRYLQMWTPEIGAAMKPARPQEYDETDNPYYFPGREEYDQAKRDPRFKNLGDSPEHRLLDRESYIIEAACARAR